MPARTSHTAPQGAHASENGTPEDRTPEEWRGPILEAAMAHIPFDGWTMKALETAAVELGAAPAMAELAFPGGVADALEDYIHTEEASFATALAATDMSSMKIREKVTYAVRLRLEMNTAKRDVAQKALTTLMLPAYAHIGPKALWATSDIIWRALKDTSTDYNWYTKRATLSAVYASTVLYWLNDDSDDFADTWAFLDRRIADVMRIETAKFKMREACKDMPSVTRFLSRLRYSAAN